MDDFDSHLKLYSAYRDYLKHEDDLINNRLSWNFTIQGFLFAAYTFTLQKASELKGSLLLQLKPLSPGLLSKDLFNSHTLGLRELHVAMIILALVGLFVSGCVYLSVSAARIAIGELERRWRELHQEYGKSGTNENTHGPHLPGLVGGGDHRAHALGFHAPTALPIGIVAAWVLLLVFTYF